MLNERVRQAVQKNLFHIYTVQHVDDAMEILTGLDQKDVDKKVQKAWHDAFTKTQIKR